MQCSADGGAGWEGAGGFASLPSRASWSFPAPPHQPHVLSIECFRSAAGTATGGIARAVAFGNYRCLGDGRRAAQGDPCSPAPALPVGVIVMCWQHYVYVLPPALATGTKALHVVVGVEVGGALLSANGGRGWREANEGLYVDVHSLRWVGGAAVWVGF